MLKLLSFTGIDNQRDSSALETDPKTGATPLTAALNVDLDLDGRMRQRAGFTEADTGIHRNLWEADGFMLATKAGDLINVGTGDVLYEQLSGSPRTWYTNLPDGRTTFSNGLICGITDGTIAGTTKWGVPIPASVGSVAPAAGGSMKPGRYRYQLTHVRTLDGLEGGPAYAGAFDVAEGEGSVAWTSLPAPPTGHSTNVYLTSHNDDTAYLAATTAGTTASFSSGNETLVTPCKSDFCYPAPAGVLTAFWRGRTLIALGNLLIASRPQQWELFDLRKEFKQLPGDLTLVQPVDGGIWVGTDTELAFLSGTTFDDLVYHKRAEGRVVLGSGVAVDAKRFKGEAVGQAMVCIADGYVCAGMPDGGFAPLTMDRYRTDATEVVAAFRMNGEIPQYIAIEQ